MKILIIKLTSMGDLMHAFPALTDATQNLQDISFDWVVDESFSEVPLWHPAVKNICTTAHRRWRKNIIKSYRAGEFNKFYRQLNDKHYDVVVDFQSNLKSAFVSWLRKTPVHGYDKASCREKPAHWAYQTHYKIDKNQHAIERQRELLAKVLNYEQPDTTADYGVDLSRCQKPELQLPEKYLVFVHNASWPTKLWPVPYWQQLIEKATQQGYSVLLPCGNASELQRAQAISANHPMAIALPKMCLNEMAAIMAGAKAAVCSDTGLAHMAAVTATPAITLYAVTDTQLIGTTGQNQQHIIATPGSIAGDMNTIKTDVVWARLKTLL